MSLYALSRSAGAKPFADTPATIVAMPPPSQRVKPRTCTRSQNPRITGSGFQDTEHSFSVRLLTAHYFRYRLASGVSGLKLVPVLDFLFILFPAPEYFFPIELAVKVDQSRLEPLEHAADLVELEQEVIDLAGDVIDAAAQR